MHMDCDHSAFHSGRARYTPESAQLRMVLVCDDCGTELEELERMEYRPRPRRLLDHLAELTARELDVSEANVARLHFAALICGAGRDRLNPDILAKPGPLSESEWSEIHREPELAAELLTDPAFDDIRDWVLHHRERPDGHGYPDGLCGAEIPLEAQILAVCEAYAAMIAERPYRRARDHRAACHELRRCAGTQFDERVVDAFLRAAEGRNERLDRTAA
jgi:HD-GYP domain-containing protein (c-di-GMP phosphodiesterase class II)